MATSDQPKYLTIVAHYESCLAKYGDSHLGVDWPEAEDAQTRYGIMLEVIKPGEQSVDLLDFGCGASHLFEYILRNKIQHIVYSGLDISSAFSELSRRKFPKNTYYCGDILSPDLNLPAFDYIVMNGVFTEKRELSFDEMLDYFKRTISQAFQKARRGIAFNVMSSHVDWQRGDLFHLPFDALASFLIANLTRNFVIRNDYGLYEYTTYVYK